MDAGASACMALNLVYSHNTVNMESVQYSIHYVRGGGGGDKCVTILCGGGSVESVDTVCGGGDGKSVNTVCGGDGGKSVDTVCGGGGGKGVCTARRRWRC